MNLFQPAIQQQAYAKVGIMGFTGSGKSYTAAHFAIGLHQMIKSDAPVSFLDTETGSDFLIPYFTGVGIQLNVSKTKAFKQLVPAVNEVAKTKGILIIDSITHFWKELTESYAAEKKRTRLLFQDWAWLKAQWGKFTDVFVNSPCHIIMCGRAGYEYDFFEDDAGKKELEKTGIKMKAETETGYEPSLLILMTRRQRLDKDEVPEVWREAVVIKDRAPGKYNLDAMLVKNPTFEDFLPHFEYLNLGGEHIGTTSERSNDMIPPDDPQWQLEKKQKEIALDEIQSLLTKHYPSQRAEDKAAKLDLLERYFGSRSWKRVETYQLNALRKYYLQLRYHFDPDSVRLEVSSAIESSSDRAYTAKAWSEAIPDMADDIAELVGG